MYLNSIFSVDKDVCKISMIHDYPIGYALNVCPLSVQCISFVGVFLLNCQSKDLGHEIRR